MLPLLWYWLSSRVDKVLMLCKFLTATSHLFFSCEMKFRWNWQEVVAMPITLLSLSIICWSLSKNMTWEQNSQYVPNLILCKAAGLNQQPVWGMGVCSDSNWTEQQLQKLGNDVRHDSESISQICSNWIVMFESYVLISVDRMSFDFLFEDFLSYLPL